MIALADSPTIRAQLASLQARVKAAEAERDAALSALGRVRLIVNEAPAALQPPEARPVAHTDWDAPTDGVALPPSPDC